MSTHSSGVHVTTYPGTLWHECGWVGLVDWWIDPEIDPDTAIARCDGCGEHVEMEMVGNSE